MDSTFWFKLVLSFIVGSAWVTLSTVIAERYGSRLGGVIAGFPSPVAVALLFIGVTQTPIASVQATTSMPLAMSLNGVFMIVYLLLARRGLAIALASALAVWFLQASIVLALDIQRFWISVAGWVLIVPICYLVVEKVMTIPSRRGVIVTYSRAQIAFRALFGGTLISFAVLMGKLGGPVYGGIFAIFPMMFISTLVITYQAGGVDFSRAMGKAIMVSATVNVPLYTMAVRYTYAWAGLAYGTAIALVFASGVGYLTYRFMRVNLS